MKNLKATKINSFEFYKSVVKSKRNSVADPDYTTRIKLFNDDIERFYKIYDDCFNKKELGKLISNGYTDKELEDLHKLYSYSQSVFQKLKTEITTTEHGRKISTCQNCSVSEINSFDHFVPKMEFAEFVVNPKNLIPSCTICNGHKSTAWRNGDKTVFLNLYLDALPNIQYLFVDVIIDVAKKSIVTTFSLNNKNAVDPDLYKIIEHHYLKLNLLNRFSENNDSVITYVINSITPNLGKLPLDEIRKSAIETSKLNKIAFGHNYWKSILEIELINNDEFVEHFIVNPVIKNS